MVDIKSKATGEVLATIDGDLYRQSDYLPEGIRRQLENYPDVETRILEDKVFRILRSTGEILDVLGI